MNTLSFINHIISVLFFVFYAYQFLYIPISWFAKRKEKNVRGPEKNRFAVLICARNEEHVIGELLESLNRQTYDRSLFDVFVIADNCTDNTARVAAESGAHVYERENRTEIGKGYALDALMRHIKEDFPKGFDGYFVIDADNLVASDFIEKMNRTFSAGHDIVTCYRNSKNYGDNWLSAGSAAWYLRESRYLNLPRYLLHVGGAVSGTGFLFGRKIAEELDGWPFHLLTEDIEFSAYMATTGRKIAYCRDAELLDGQPTEFAQSFRQRTRWAKGYLQVYVRYFFKLLKGIFKGSFTCFDMLMNLVPAFVLSFATVICTLSLGIWGACIGDDIMIAVKSFAQVLIGSYLALYVIGLITTVTEWRSIRASTPKKILYTFTFPIFLFTYIPVVPAAIFSKAQWKPIEHKPVGKDGSPQKETK